MGVVLGAMNCRRSLNLQEASEYGSSSCLGGCSSFLGLDSTQNSSPYWPIYFVVWDKGHCFEYFEVRSVGQPLFG